MDVCYVVTHGFSARMVLHSDLVPALTQRGLSVGVIAPGADEDGFASLAAARGAKAVMAPTASRRATLLSDVYPYFMEDMRRHVPLWARHQRAVATASSWKRKGRVFGSYAFNQTVRRVPGLSDAVARLARTQLDDARATRLLEKERPRLLVATYPVATIEASLLLAAERLGIPTAIHLLSWDNITCKGRFPVLANDYIAWGPVMRDELVEHYGVARERIQEVGVPHFDAHVKRASRERLAALLNSWQLAPDRPYLFFGMSSPVFAPTEIDVVEWLAKEVRADRFGADMQLVVRPHPQNVSGYMADTSWLPRLRRLQGSRVGVNFPNTVKDSSLAWAMAEDDLVDLASLLAGASVCVNSGSTLCLDAIVHDCPVVVTVFDVGRERPWWQSARRLREYPHLAKLFEHGGVDVTASLEATGAAIAAYVADARRHADTRAATRAAYLGAADGGSAERAAAAVERLVKAAQSRAA